MELLQKIIKEARDFWFSENNLMSKLVVRGYIVALPAIFYITSLFTRDDDGEKFIDPNGVFEHALWVLVVCFGTVFFYAAIILIVLAADSKKGQKTLDVIATSVGMRNSRRATKNLKKLNKTLKNAELRPEILLEHLRLANEASMEIQNYPLEPRGTLARTMSDKLIKKTRTAVSQTRAYVSSEQALASAKTKSAEILNTGQNNLDEKLVYFSVDGQLDGYALILASKYMIAGKNPLEPKDSWGNSLVGEYYMFTALLCAPLWVQQSNLARGDAYADDVLIKISGTEEAKGSYKDTVANLWNPDRWHMYHRPDRLVRAAKMLDTKRRGGEEHLVV